MKEKFNLVVQGPHHPNTFRTLDKHKCFGQRVISCYKTCPYFEDKLPEDVVVVRNTGLFNSSLGTTLPLQIQSTLSGLKLCMGNGWPTIKIRSDEYYDNLDPFIEAINESPTKLTTCNIFFLPPKEGSEHTYFHISDHLMGGNNQLMLQAFNLANTIISQYKGTPFGIQHSIESFLALSFLHQVSGKSYLVGDKAFLRDINIVKHLTSEHFNCVDIDKLGPYEWKCAGKTYNNADYLYDNGYNQSIRNIYEIR